ncbi:hypothetical protein LWM68_34770 [Niabella sp. W65]|nr:hypothetical protein [Niabella sp. W65]MCH7367473.1 hypothetical protein [Niabella sp. W65]
MFFLGAILGTGFFAVVAAFFLPPPCLLRRLQDGQVLGAAFTLVLAGAAALAELLLAPA